MSTIPLRKKKSSAVKKKDVRQDDIVSSGETLDQKTYQLAPDVRKAMGKEIRKSCPRKALGLWNTQLDRRDPIDILIESSVGRLADLVPIRYGRMMNSPFAFYRGAAAIMANDLATTECTELYMQICGDCHLMNFGGFASPERKLVFDINDFDETSIGPWEWDIKRLTASMVVAARDNGFTPGQAEDIAWATAAAYRDHVSEYAGMPLLEAWYDQMSLEKIIDDMRDSELKEFAEKQVQKASESTAHTKEFVKLAIEGGEPPRIQDVPPLIFHDSNVGTTVTQSELEKAFAHYRATLSPERRLLLDRFKVADFAMKVVGVGSVGTYCGIILLVSGSGDPLFLQVKEARPSVLAPFVGIEQYTHQGERVVHGQRLMQAASDIFLGWTEGPHRQFYLRQLRDAKVSPRIDLLKADNLKRYGELCSRALARAHARSGDMVLLTSYLGKGDAFPDALKSFSVSYADQNERDHESLVKAVRAGRIEIQAEA